MTRKLFASALFASCLCVPALSAGADIGMAHREDNAAANATEIIEMRSTLAKTFIQPGAEVTEDTFKKVCGAVGKRVKEISEKEGVRIRHASLKNRNPLNSADAGETGRIKRFEDNKKLSEVWDDVTADGNGFRRYTRPIYVEEACLACHGKKEARPAFIVEKYPNDKAYDYKKGNLRGVISVTIPVE